MQTRTIAGGAIIIGILSLASRLVGLLRDRIFAGTFGTGDTLDVYYAAFQIPDTVFALLVMGALSASFIPIFTKRYYDGISDNDSAWNFTNKILSLISIAYVAVALIGIIFAGQLSQIIAPGFAELKQAHVASFMRVMFFAQFFLAVSTVFGSVLQATRRFLVFSLAPVFYNAGIILGALFLVKYLGAIGLAWGVVLGALLHTLISCVGMKGLGYKFKLPKKVFDDDTKQTIFLMIPRVLGLGVNQLHYIVLSVIASGLIVGSVSSFQLAFNLQFFPVGILGVSYAISVFPVLSRNANDGNISAFVESFSMTIRQLIYLIVPATIIFLLLRAQIVRVVLGAGVFGWDETILVADTLAFFSLSFFAQSISYILVRGLFAFKDSITPLIAGIVGVIIMIFASMSLSDSYGTVGLAMSFSIASIVQTVLLWVMLRMRTGTLGEGSIINGLFKMTIAGIGMGLIMQFAKPLTLTILSLETFFGVLFQGAFVGIVGLIAYIGLTYALRTEELVMIRSGLDRKLFSRFHPSETTTDS